MKTAQIESRDPWAHRSKMMKCSTCIWFVVKKPTLQLDESPNQLGRCRRRAPTLDGYPAVFEQDWCGDHKLDENKI